jgi:3-hydroxyacyl-[acyl-carrier-protein] dehydratase
MNKEALSMPPSVDLDIEAVKRLLPHRPPMLMIDRLSDIHSGQSAVGWKAVTINEPYFAGHFPQYAVMPGVLLVETMAQAAGALVVHSLAVEDERRMVYFLTIDKARFRRPVRPGDLLRVPVRIIRHSGPVWRFQGNVFVGDELCAEAQYSAMLTERSFDSIAPATPSGTE